MNRAPLIILVALLVLASQAFAQKPTNDTLRTRLGFLAGTFATETKIPPNPEIPNGGTGKGTSVITWALDSMFLAIEQQGSNTLFGEYKGHGMLGYDRQASQYVLSMFNNWGDRLTYTGNFIGDTLVMTTRVPMPEMSFDQKLLWYKDGDEVKLKVLNDIGKGFEFALEETDVPVAKRTEK